MSAKVETTNIVRNLEQDTNEQPEWVTVLNHWNRRGLVVLEVDGCPRVTVRADLLKKAIENATNQPIV